MIARDPTDFNVLDWLRSWRRPRAKAAEIRVSDYMPVATVSDAELAELRRILRRRKSLTNQQVADLMGVTKGEASKRVSKAVAAGIVSRRKAGKQVAITLH